MSKLVTEALALSLIAWLLPLALLLVLALVW
jgi:hypothetical protein